MENEENSLAKVEKITIKDIQEEKKKNKDEEDRRLVKLVMDKILEFGIEEVKK